MKLTLFGGIDKLLRERGMRGLTDFCVSAGLDGIEGYNCAGLTTADEAKALRKLLDDAGLSCPCFSVGADLAADFGPTLDALKRYMDMASILGADKLHHTLVPWLKVPGVTAPRFNELFDTVAERAGQVCDMAAKQGLTVLYEGQGYYFNGADRMERLLGALNRPNAGICADVGNPLFVDEDPRTFVGRLMPYVRHVHLCDYMVRSADAPEFGAQYRSWTQKQIKDMVCGQGDIPLRELFIQLSRAGYDGAFALEFYSEPFEEGCRSSADYIRRLYRETIG